MTNRKSLYEKITNWELWPFKLRYFLISPVWLWYCLRARSLWFFTSSNPTLTFGGFEGEGKQEMYDLLPPHLYPKTIYIQPGSAEVDIQKKLQKAGIEFPLIVKPDVGMKGLLFRKIDLWDSLKLYHGKMPFPYIIQDLVTYPLEVSVFYYRFPNKEKGVITGFIQKDLMEVKGNGRSTLLQLIKEHPKARYREEEMKLKHGKNLNDVIPEEERFILTYAANLNRGASFTNLNHLIDQKLRDIFDELSHQAKFYYGRYDLKCHSIEDLKAGKNFMILEFNGSGAEPNHVYNCNLSLGRAYREFLFHWNILFKISVYNKNHGIPYWPFWKGWKFLNAGKKHLKLLESLDREIIL